MKKKYAGGIVWLAAAALYLGAGILERQNTVEAQVEYDNNMSTEAYHVDVELSEDNSYLVTETIAVDMHTPRHGIYRYVPQKGYSEAYNVDGETERIPYYAEIEVLSASTEIETEYSDGFFVMRLGSEDETVLGEEVYEISYRYTPRFQEKDFTCAYYNLFPMTWQNEIPAGSSFSFTFPQAFDHEELRLYSGQYGSTQDGEELLNLTWEGETLRGVLKEDLPFLSGITLFARLGTGYFTEIHLIPPVGMIILAIAVVILALMAALYWFFGRDEEIIPSIQFQPPQGMDSAAVGYVVDGSVEDKDILSLIIYWADQGYLVIEDKGKGKLSFTRTGKPFPADSPAYARNFFNKLFEKGDQVSLDSLKYQCADTIAASKTMVRAAVNGKEGIYTRASRIARGVCMVLGVVPMGLFVIMLSVFSKLSAFRIVFYVVSVLLLFVGISLFSYVVDTWYSGSRGKRVGQGILGAGLGLLSVAGLAGSYVMQLSQGEVFRFVPALIAVAVSSVGAVFFTGFMKKRTSRCVKWMGQLAGLRDFIETAELERLKALAEENPQWFYHILPYTYVMGLSDIFASKLESLAIPAPQWYTGYRKGYPVWNYYYFHHSLMRSMNRIHQTLPLSEPPKASDNGGGGGFSSGGSFGGGGGFSGGGFGGGGGGSW